MYCCKNLQLALLYKYYIGIMNKNIVIEKIKSIGFTSSEACIYIACLECGTNPASIIATKAKLNRVTTYDILDKLLNKWVVTSSNIKWIKCFTAIDPKIFIDDINNKAIEFAKTLPFMQSILKNDDTHPTVRFFKWIDSIKKAYKESLRSKTIIYNYANSKNIRDHWPEYDDEYVIQRMKNKIFLKWITPNDMKWKWVQKHDSDFYRETKLLPKEKFKVENEIKIFDNKMFICSYEPQPFAIIIESEAVANTQRQIFEILWDII